MHILNIFNIYEAQDQARLFWKTEVGIIIIFRKGDQFSSVTQSYMTLCDPMDCSTPGLPVRHQHPEFAQTHIHPIISSSVIPFSSCLQSFPASGSFQMSQLFTSGGQSFGVLASTSVLPMNTQD